MEKFDLEHQYREYLRLMKLDESKMHPVQKVETKRVFYGACGQILMLLQQDISELDEEKGVEVLQNMLEQCVHFFQKELNRQN